MAWNFGSPIIDTLYAELLFSETMPVFGTLREVRSILLYENEGPPYIFWLAKGIGKIRDIYDDGTIADLNYAKISNKIYGTIVSVKNEQVLTPDNFQVSQNYPNPFNPSTVINFSIKDAGLVRLKVYDILGSEVVYLVNETKSAGYHSVEFNAANLQSGIYIYTLQVNDYSASKKMILIK